jgi:hypothetical protein
MSSDPRTHPISRRLRARRLLYSLSFRLCRQLAIRPLPADWPRPCRQAFSPGRGQAFSPGRSILAPEGSYHVPTRAERPL